MATTIYQSDYVTLIDGTELYLTPLKIKYLREFMDSFEFVKTSADDEQAIFFLVDCARVAMKQYYPAIKTVADMEDMADIKTIYKIIDVAANIKINKPDKEVKEQATKSGQTWDDLDLAKLESEAFLLGIWKDYEELESSLSMPELSAILEAKRDQDYNEKKFFAAIQGVDLDKQSGRQEQDPWEAMKARVFSGGTVQDGNDIASFQGPKAAKAGFGVGMGLSYQKVEKKTKVAES